jgi:hypothetical protein
VIRKGRDKDYYDFWKRGVQKNGQGELLKSDLIGFTEIVDAKNKQEALQLIQRKHPTLTIDRENIERL